MPINSEPININIPLTPMDKLEATASILQGKDRLDRDSLKQVVDNLDKPFTDEVPELIRQTMLNKCTQLRVQIGIDVEIDPYEAKDYKFSDASDVVYYAKQFVYGPKDIREPIKTRYFLNLVDFASTTKEERELIERLLDDVESVEDTGLNTFELKLEEEKSRPPEILGKYQIGETSYSTTAELGEGKYGKAYLAHDNEANEVVIKVSNSNLNQKDTESFIQEPKTLNDLYQAQKNSQLGGDQPFTPEVLGQGKTSDGREFFVMSLAIGTDITEMMHGNLPDTKTIVTIGRQFSCVLVALHQQLKKSYYDYQPKNIYWDKDKQRISVIDWNLLAPTVLENGTFVAADPKNDLYVFCQSILTLATGVWAKSPGEVNDILEQKNIQPELANLLKKGLSEDKSQRYRSAAELWMDFVSMSELTAQ